MLQNITTIKKEKRCCSGKALYVFDAINLFIIYVFVTFHYKEKCNFNNRITILLRYVILTNGKYF